MGWGPHYLLLPHLHEQRIAGSSVGTTCARQGSREWEAGDAKDGETLASPPSQTPSRLCPLRMESLAAVGVDEKEKLLDKKKFEKKKVSEIFKLESDIIETAAHGSVHSNLFKLGA